MDVDLIKIAIINIGTAAKINNTNEPKISRQVIRDSSRSDFLPSEVTINFNEFSKKELAADERG